MPSWDRLLIIAALLFADEREVLARLGFLIGLAGSIAGVVLTIAGGGDLGEGSVVGILIALASTTAWSLLGSLVKKWLPGILSSYGVMMASGLLAVGLAHYLFYKSVPVIGVSVAASLDLVRPLLAVVLSFFLFGERLLPLQILGGGFLVLGAYLVIQSRFRQRGLRVAEIISASRRTDIPSFYGHWFEERLEAGYVSYRNPFDARKVYRVSLAPDDVLAFVFWSKDFGPFLPVLTRIGESRPLPVLFNYTITGYGADLETHVPDLEKRLDTVDALGLLYSPRSIFWRYDTIVVTDVYTRLWHRENFRRLCERLTGRVDRCIISFLQVYSKVARNLGDIVRHKLEPSEETDFARELAGIAGPYGLSVYSCCQDHLTGEGVLPSACIDGEHLRRLYPECFPDPIPAKGTRRQCRCAASRDIGAYDTCGHGCRYCYAVRDHHRALQATNAPRQIDTVVGPS